MKRFVSLLLVLALVCVSFAALGEGTTYKLGDRKLVQNMTGTDVLEAQQRLAYYKYYTGAQDGIFGSGMLKAVKLFQRSNSLVVDGRIGPLTAVKLLSAAAVAADAAPAATVATLSSGDSGEAVKTLQRQLRETYYYTGKIDGIYGSDVYSAVKEFQLSVGLKADGKAGAKTQDALYNRTAAIFNGGIPTRFLDSGCRGYDVYVLQQKLLSLNFLAIEPSGYYGEDTVSAVKKLEASYGLKETGKTGPTVRRYLWPSTVDAAEENANASKGTADDPYQERSLRKGMYGDDVANAQMRLKAARYLLGNADGIFGAKTEAAVIALQKDYNLKADGVIGAKTWEVLKTFNISNVEPDVVETGKPAVSAPTSKLRRGDRGSEVKLLQQALIQLGFLAAGEDDGVFGTKTYNAVIAFQKSQGLTADGVVGSKTLVRLNEALGIQWNTVVG